MKSFPMFIDVAGRSVVIVGGGEQAAQKARLMLKTEARLTFVAGALCDELRGVVGQGRATHRPLSALAETLAAARFAFVASGCAGADASTAALARALGVLVNVVDRPELCDLTTPALVDRDPVVIAVGTEGAAPVLARRLKTAIEEMLEPRLGDFAALAGRLRAAVATKVPRARQRAFWAWAFGDAPRRAHRAGDEEGAARLLSDAIERGGAPGAATGLVSLVGAGPGAPDLMTLRAVQRLQEADVIFYDRLVDASALELARRDAERVFVGKHVGAAAWPQDRINRVVVAAAKAGKRVVRLKCGDPLVFGRAAEEAAACEAGGVAWEVVPGVTSALAAAAAAQVFPTARAATWRLTLATATRADGRPPADLWETLRPGGTVALYMGAAEAPEICSGLLEAGAPGAIEVTVVEEAETARARTRRMALSAAADALRQRPVQAPAIVLLQWPEGLAAGQAKELSEELADELAAGRGGGAAACSRAPLRRPDPQPLRQTAATADVALTP